MGEIVKTTFTLRQPSDNEIAQLEDEILLSQIASKSAEAAKADTAPLALGWPAPAQVKSRDTQPSYAALLAGTQQKVESVS